MTLRQAIRDRLVDYGLLPPEADVVLGLAGHVEDLDATGCDQPTVERTWQAVRSVAIEHLRATNPGHFALAVLLDDLPLN